MNIGISSKDKKRENVAVKAAGVVGFATLLSRITGLIRDQAIACFLSKDLTDPFFLAYKIPNFLRAIFAEGALSSAYIPVFNQKLDAEDKNKSHDFFCSIFIIIVFITILISILGIIAAPLIIKIYSSGWNESFPEMQEIAIPLLKIMFPYIFFISIAAIFMGTLNSLKYFFIPALSPVFLNLAMVLGMIIGFFVFEMTLYGLAWGVLIGGFLQAFSQFIVLKRIKYKPILRFKFNSLEVKKVFNLTVTAAIGASIFQINSGIDTWLASYLEKGSVTFLNYGNRLIQFPLAFFGLSLVIAYFPEMSRSASLGNIEELKKSILESVDLIMFLSFPAIVTMLILPQHIVDILFRHGKFGYDDMISTALVIFCYGIGLWAVSVGKLYVRVFHSLQDMWTPVRIGIYSTILNFVLNIILMQFISYAGLALATSISSIYQLYLLSKKMENKIGQIKSRFFDLKYFKFILSSIIMAIFFNFTAGEFYQFNDSLVTKGFHLFWVLISGWFIYFILNRLLGCEEVSLVSKILLKRK